MLFADALQPLGFPEFVPGRDTDLYMDRCFEVVASRIGAQIVNEVVLLYRRRIAEEAFDPSVHQPGVVARLEIPEVMMCVDDLSHGG